CRHAVRWWKARMERCELPPLSKVITYVRESDRRWRPTGVLWFRLPHIRERIPEWLQSSATPCTEKYAECTVFGGWSEDVPVLEFPVCEQERVYAIGLEGL